MTDEDLARKDQTITLLMGRVEDQKEQLATVQRTLATLQAENEELRDWRATVTAALGREGGVFYDDVPKFVRGMRQELRDIEELEAKFCPEDVGFDEYITALEARAASAEAALQAIRALSAKWWQANQMGDRKRAEELLAALAPVGEKEDQL